MSWRRAIILVAERELRERLRSKAFLASTALILALVGVSALLGRLADPHETYRVAVPAAMSIASRSTTSSRIARAIWRVVVSRGWSFLTNDHCSMVTGPVSMPFIGLSVRDFAKPDQ